MIVNGLSFDIEDWRQIVHWKMTGERVRPDPQVVRETERILEVLAAAGARATFFVLANVAEAYPELVRRIAAAGHEVGSHGWSHAQIYRQTPEEFRDETVRAKALLEGILGRPIHGYRAAEFSITRKSWWALDVLADAGFTYDSSVYPIAGERYGVPDAPLEPHTVKTASGAITEIPMTAVEWRGARRAVGGGGYLRLLPYTVTERALRSVNREGRAAVVYLHPYELAEGLLWVSPPAGDLRAYKILARHALVHNFARDRVRRRLVRLLTQFQFRPLEEIARDADRS